jgi:hypothetical protein
MGIIYRVKKAGQRKMNQQENRHQLGCRHATNKNPPCDISMRQGGLGV